MQQRFAKQFSWLLLCLLLSSLASCHAGTIMYKSDSKDVQQSIQAVLSKISQDVASDVRKKNVFVLVYDRPGAIVMIFNKAQNLPPEYKDVVIKSNRFFLLNDGQKIPVIFPWDCLTTDRKGNSWHLGGHVIEIDYYHKIIHKGNAW
jgi:hypothetical protein